jgi:hypothetical protein
MKSTFLTAFLVIPLPPFMPGPSGTIFVSANLGNQASFRVIPAMPAHKALRGEAVKVVVPGSLDGHGLSRQVGLDVFARVTKVRLAKDGAAFRTGKDETLNPLIASLVAELSQSGVPGSMRARARTPPDGDPFVLAQHFLCLSARSDTGCVRSIRFFAAGNAVLSLGTFSAADSNRGKVIPAVICYYDSVLCCRPPGATMFQKEQVGVGESNHRIHGIPEV